MSQTIIGLDIGHYSVKVLRLKASYRGFSAEVFDEEPLDKVQALDPALLAEQAAGAAPPPLPPGVAPLDGADESGAEDEQAGFTEEELRDAIHDAEDEALYTALSALRERGALGVEEAEVVIVSMPADLILTGRMTFPFTDPRQLAAIIPAEYEDKVPVDIGELLVTHHLVGPSNLEPALNDVFVAAVKREDLEIHLERWRDGFVNPQQVVGGDAAMLHLGAYLLPEMTEPYAVVDIGHVLTRVACLEPATPDESGKSADGLLLGYARTMEHGGRDLTSVLAVALECTDEEAEAYKHRHGELTMNTAIVGVDDIRASDAMKRELRLTVRELRRTFQAHLNERRVGVTRVFLCGGGSRLGNLAPYLSEELGIPVEPLPLVSDELASLDLATSQSPLMAQALALALTDAMPRGLSKVALNFRLGAFAHKGARSWVRERMMGMVVLVAMLMCALGAMFVTDYYAIAAEEEALKASLERATKQLFDKSMQPDAVERELKGKGGNANLLPRYSAYDYFLEVSKRTPEGSEMEFAKIEVDLFRQIVTIQATTTNVAVVESYTENLEQFECFKGKVNTGNTETIGSDKLRFDLSIAPECPGSGGDDKKKKN